MSITRPIIEQSLIDKIQSIKPSYITTRGFIHVLLEEAIDFRVNKNAKLTNNIDYIYTNNKDLEDKKLIFPRFDSLSIGLALENEGKNILEADLNPLYDSLSECIVEIEELKNELTTIVMSQTSTGAYARDKWDTPDTKGAHGKKGKLRKDRYSSLLISNMIARKLDLKLEDVQYNVIGGSTREIVKPNSDEMYQGPEWFTNSANDDIYRGINK